jgi:hypothetical protein
LSIRKKFASENCHTLALSLWETGIFHKSRLNYKEIRKAALAGFFI